MPVSNFIRLALVGPVVAVAAAGLIGFANFGFSAVLVGETRQTQPSPKATAAIDAMKAEYRRPAMIPFPKENPYTPEKAALGKKLYFDTRLSVTSAQSCASCHSPGFGWGDGLAVGVGHGMAKLGRHSPTIINAAWGAIFMWDGRLANLEEQALGPIQAAGEMNMPLDKLMARLASIAEYKPLFEASFPGVGLKPATLAQAIATYERTVVSEQAPFDPGSRATRRPFPKMPSAASCCSTPRRCAPAAMRAGISPMTASRTSASPARISAAANSCPTSSR